MKLNGYNDFNIVIILFYLIHFASSRQISVVSSSDQLPTNQVKVIGVVPETSFITQPAVITTGVTKLQTGQEQHHDEVAQPMPPQEAQAQVWSSTAATPHTVACAPQGEPISNQQNSPNEEKALCAPTETKNAASVSTSDSVQKQPTETTDANENKEDTAKDPAITATQQAATTEEESKEEVKVEPIEKETKAQETETEKKVEPIEKDTKVQETETEKKVEPIEKDTKVQETETEKTKEKEAEVEVNEKEGSSSTTDNKEEKRTEKVDHKASKIDSLLSTVTGRKVCHSPHCQKVAKSIMESINKSVDPCDNYYDYACGTWIKEHKIPKFHTQYSRISELSENNEKLLMDSLKKDQITDTDTLMKVKMFYRSCMDRKSIDKAGAGPLKDYINELGSWDVSKQWKSKEWNFYDTLTKMHRQYPAEVFFTVDVHSDPTETHANASFIILLDQATLNLPQIIYFTSPKIIRLVSKYMTHIVSMSGCNEKSAADKVRDIMKFETKLATISVPKIAKKYVRIPLSKLAKAVPEFPWMEHLSGVFSPKTINNDTKVIVLANDYLPNLFELLRKTDKSTLSNYMVWRLVKDVVPLLSEEFREEHFKLKKKLLGVKREKPREKKCFGYANNLLGPLMGALFVKNAFSPESKHKVESMMEGIIKAFKDNIEHVDWVDKDTVTAVEEKADKAVYKVGYPDYLWDEDKFSQRYSMLNMTEGNWFDNVLETDKFASLQTFKKLNTVSDIHQWITVPHLVNAFYVITKNEIVIPSGILQPPFFYPEEIPRSLSYGAIGHVLGHELTHGFDTTGRKYNKVGEEIDPADSKALSWSNSSIKAFEKRAKCLVEQFSKYKILGKFHIDGFKTLGENIADGGGVKMAFHAYRDFLETHNDEEILPYLNMPHEKLFFLGYAQKECVRTTPAAEFLAVMEDVHPLSKYRVIGTLSNNEDFSKVYKCKPGSGMNPVKKCEVW